MNQFVSTNLRRYTISAICLLTGMTVARSTSAQSATSPYYVVSKASSQQAPVDAMTQKLAGYAGKMPVVGQAFSALYDLATSFFNPAPGSPPPPVTADQLYAALDALGTAINSWEVIELENQKGGEFLYDVQLALACPSCALGVDNQFGQDMAEFTVDYPTNTALFLRTANNTLVQGDWQEGIPQSQWAPVTNGLVFDWRGGLPYFMYWLAERIAFMKLVDGDSFPQGVHASEIGDYIRTLGNLTDVLRGGIKCGLGWHWFMSSPCDNGSQLLYPVEYCADVYSGTYTSSQKLGPDRCADDYGHYSLNSSDTQVTQGMLNDLQHSVYNKLPIDDIIRLRSTLELYLNPHTHGFMIRTDSGTSEPLYANAYGGAAPGTVLRVHRDCRTSNPDCTWNYANGMLISDNTWNGTLAIQLVGSQLVLTNTCTQTDPSCQWYFDGGHWSQQVPGWGTFSIALLDGPTNISRLGPGTGLGADVRWSIPHVLFTPAQFGTSMAMRAWGSSLSSPPFGTGDAGEQGPVTAYATSVNPPTASPAPCFSNNPDCTWTVGVDGMIVNDNSPSDDPLGLNQWGGNVSGSPLVVTGWCAGSNPDCTWKISPNGISSDNGGRFIYYSKMNSYGYLWINPPCSGYGCSASGTVWTMRIAAD